MLWSPSGTALPSFLDRFLVLARLQPPHEIFRVKVRPHGILLKFLRHHKVRRRVIVIKVIDLRLELVAVGILVVNRGRDAVVDAPRRN